jgi:hypothetical protein
MVNKLLLVVMLFIATNVSCMEMFKRGDTCKIVAGPLKGSGDTILIDCTAYDKCGVETIEAVVKDKDLLIFPNISTYVKHCAKTDKKLDLHTLSVDDLKEDHRGVFYYGHSIETGIGSYFHPTWLEKIEKKVS